MKLYDNYIDNIKKAIARDRNDKCTSLTFSNESRNFSNVTNLSSKSKFDLTPLNSLTPLLEIVGSMPVSDQKLGEHPDFKHLKETNTTENHYITSVFIDIKNSTQLYRHYDLDTIMVITNTIQRAAIHTCIVYGGYIHRLQGDGVFVYFGGKHTPKQIAVTNALKATSLFSYFVKHDLKNIFEQQGIEDIYTRIGIDFGHESDVLWALAGIGDCSEVTTYSLHTSLASKMQAIANSNGIVVGENVKTISLVEDRYFDTVKDSKGEIKKQYIFEDRNKGFYYKPNDFKWLPYLKSLPFITEDVNGDLRLITKEEQDSKQRLLKLNQTASLINNGNAFTNQNGIISENQSGIKNMEHRFHYE